MAKSLVTLAEEISALSPNELQTLGKIVIAKQQMVQPQQQGPMAGGPAPMPPQMNQAPQQGMPQQRMAPPTSRDAMMPGLLGR